MARITEVIEPEANALGFDLVRVRLFRSGEIGPISGPKDGGGDDLTLQIMAENPATGQLLIEDCAALSHRISDRFDALEEAGEVLLADAYRLEVSSPGIDRPLTRAKDFAAWTGHEARVQLTEPVAGNRTSLHGEVAGITGDLIAFDDRKSGRVEFPLADVESARLILTDKLIAASRPVDPKGADEIETADDNVTADILEERED